LRTAEQSLVMAQALSYAKSGRPNHLTSYANRLGVHPSGAHGEAELGWFWPFAFIWWIPAN
jgi:hypothetical protein